MLYGFEVNEQVGQVETVKRWTHSRTPYALRWVNAKTEPGSKRELYVVTRDRWLRSSVKENGNEAVYLEVQEVGKQMGKKKRDPDGRRVVAP